MSTAIQKKIKPLWTTECGSKLFTCNLLWMLLFLFLKIFGDTITIIRIIYKKTVPPLWIQSHIRNHYVKDFAEMDKLMRNQQQPFWPTGNQYWV